MSRKYLVDGIEMTARELIQFAEQQYGCQKDEALKYTSVASEELKRHGVNVKEITKQALKEAEK